jgi:hypothetical protein
MRFRLVADVGAAAAVVVVRGAVFGVRLVVGVGARHVRVPGLAGVTRP